MRRHPERGSAAVEFAVLLPAFIALLLGIAEYGWLFFHEVVVANAAREGARTGVTRAPDDAEDGPTAAAARVSQYLAASGLACAAGCTVDARDSGASPERMLEVEIAYAYAPLLGFVPTPAELRALSSMRYEVQY